MVRKCGYLPLVISLLGGVLKKKNSTEGWELVNKNINAYLYRGEGIDKEDEIHGVLSLSYDDLPYYLKLCFLYMGQFREDQTIYVRTLYRLWIAEGMISHNRTPRDDETTLMDIAELYLSELASRSLVQVQVEDEARDQKYSTCRLHDVLRSLCLEKAKNEDFGLQIIENYQGVNLSTLLGPKTRHLAVHCHDQGEGKPQNDGCEKYIRSLQFINVTNEKKIEFPCDILDFQKFKLLRVLLIHGCKFKERKLPKGIANLVLLKYLGLFYCVLDKLPSSISSLTYLYSLDLLGSWNVRVPNVLDKMHRLKHLVLPYYDKEKIGKYKLRLEGLEELEILYGFNSLVHDLKSVIRMKNLRRFEAIAHDNGSLLAIIDAIITSWKKLRFCKLVIRQGCQFTTTEEDLMILKKVYACPNLHDLRIHVHVGKLIHECRSEMIGSRVVHLQLMECEIEEDPMEILGKLPLLEQLFLSNRSIVGDKMKCDAMGFPCLKNLVLKCLPNLREWIIEKGAMPVVSEIEISYCSCLEMVPDGLRFTRTLQTLKICGMSELGRRVLASSDGGREGEDFDKVRHVPFITIIG
ncbi:hypothetical protein CDL12_15846 [Handroanthus impetiginosus]|uniref:NB-ARC domain-containing protein n=1 Tax=Handroanthus impetiginosus TaxID=429701 RepID=A0A2G9H238_9LAMI|nr:hypothetical protein CDL12_15846 [Handroanthus impetiginosus]